MSRNTRTTPPGMPFHVLNRGVNKQTLFHNDYDYAAFEEILSETLDKTPVRILAYCLMPNHWHFVLWPEESEQLAAFMQRLTITHATRWQKHYDRVGQGHVYQGRFKSFPIETEEYLYRVLRYVERNALRAGLVERAEEWPWSSLWIRANEAADYLPLLSDWPVCMPENWVQHVNEVETEAELTALRNSCNRGTPYGSPGWVEQTTRALGLESTLRKPGRPRKR
ncbi:MAG: transposase [Planctomycetota bacterium]